jgi:hypothetical protein
MMGDLSTFAPSTAQGSRLPGATGPTVVVLAHLPVGLPAAGHLSAVGPSRDARRFCHRRTLQELVSR